MNRDVKFKIDEAQFYIRKMKENFNDDPDRRYYLSAFLSSAKSVDYYLKSLYGHLEKFDQWRQSKLRELSIISNVDKLVKLRDNNVHHSPTSTKSEASYRLSNIVPLVKESDAIPYLLTKSKEENSQSDLKEKQNPKIEKWRFHGEFEYEIIPFCESELENIKLAAVEADKLFSKL